MSTGYSHGDWHPSCWGSPCGAVASPGCIHELGRSLKGSSRELCIALPAPRCLPGRALSLWWWVVKASATPAAQIGALKDGWTEVKKPPCIIKVTQAFPFCPLLPPWWFPAKSVALSGKWLIFYSLTRLLHPLRCGKLKLRAMCRHWSMIPTGGFAGKDQDPTWL